MAGGEFRAAPILRMRGKRLEPVREAQSPPDAIGCREHGCFRNQTDAATPSRDQRVDPQQRLNASRASDSFQQLIVIKIHEIHPPGRVAVRRIGRPRPGARKRP